MTIWLKKFVFLCSLIVGLSALPTFALAQPQENQVSTATLMAAALETAGYAGQSAVLRDLGFVLDSMALLILVGAAIGGLISVILFGSYRVAAWFLIGPALFHFVTKTTVLGYGAEWQFGTTDNITSEIGDAINPSVEAEVSWVFDEYNKLVSSVIQNMIHVVTNDSTRNRMKFMTRQQIMDYMLRGDISKPGLSALVQYGFAQCAEAMDAARIKGIGARDQDYQQTIEYKIANGKYETLINRRRVSIPNGIVHNYLNTLLESYLNPAISSVNSQGSQFNSNRNAFHSCLEGTAARGEVSAVLAAPASCNELWCWMGLGLQSEVLDMQAQAESEFVAEDVDATLRQQIWQDIALKLADPTPLVSGATEAGLVGLQQPDVSLIPVIIGGYLLRKQMSGSGFSHGMQQFAEHAGVELQPFEVNFEKMTPDQHQAWSQRFLHEQMAAAKRWEVFTLAMTLPYIQGILLYILALMFPFFSLMLILPGQSSAFFQWMALWAWVKFWDLGWAFVMVVDELLWNFMPHSATYDPTLDPNHGPESVFAAAFSGDPAYSLGNYYMIVSLLLVSVPIVSAQAVLGAKAVIGNTLIEGMQKLGARFGGNAAAGIAVRQSIEVGRLRQVHAANWQKDSFQGQESQKIMDAANAADAAGDKWWAGAGAAAGIGGAVTGLGALAGGIPGLVAGAITGNTVYQSWKTGRDLHRMANDTRVEWKKANEAERLFATKDTKTDRILLGTLGAIKGGRNSHIFVRDSPDELFAKADQIAKEVELRVQEQEFKGGSSIVGSLPLTWGSKAMKWGGQMVDKAISWIP